MEDQKEWWAGTREEVLTDDREAIKELMFAFNVLLYHIHFLFICFISINYIYN